jgi:hypothetical protein
MSKQRKTEDGRRKAATDFKALGGGSSHSIRLTKNGKVKTIRTAERKFARDVIAPVVNKINGFPVTGTCFFCGCTEFGPCAGGCSWANRKHTLCSKCSEKLNKLNLMNVAIAAIVVARSAHCRISEGADLDYALIYKVTLNKLKRELRSFAPRCLGKE